MVADFHWVLPNQLAGSAMPGLLAPAKDDYEALARIGIKLVVNLTENPVHPSPAEFGMETQHFPIDDMGIPLPRDAAVFCRSVLDFVEEGGKVLLHCRAGKGRTGLMLASCLVTLGRSAQEAMDEVRLINPYYIESTAQERFLGHYAEYLDAEAVGAISP